MYVNEFNRKLANNPVPKNNNSFTQNTTAANQGRQYFTQADMTKLKKALPKFKFSKLEDAVLDYVQHHLAKSDSYLGHS
jgi:hypothetical protein